MNKDKTYLLKEIARTIDESDSTAAFCLCQRWILKDALALLKEQPEIVKCKDCFYADAFDCPAPLPTGYLCQKEHGCHKGDWFCADGVRKEGR